ncbi:hypothetical protein [Apilactobacillus kunkeei]|uniref:hypothetical protein n=1 Tax=Apilactobacillus kunkeei TaxID=148814 RepID=UPI0006B23ECD|nr:hypothetical protein [Apilactobacillus kunkeei]KOY69469.1 hypothetical protein RZ73_08650 [Apilactobacillus kunkeei]CAI2685322.1 hypothetical protein AKUFHON2_09580 [Apilactobacillus kunkeei]
MKKEDNFLDSLECFLKKLVNNLKIKLNKALDRYKYLIISIFFLAIIIVIPLCYYLLNKSSNQISIIISILSLIISSYLGFRNPKCKIVKNVSVTKGDGIFIELYSNNSATCIVNIERIVVINEHGNNKLIITDWLSNILPKEIVKSYILSNDSISVIPIVDVERKRISAYSESVQIKMNLAKVILDIYKNYPDIDEYKTIEIEFRRSDNNQLFTVPLDFNEVIDYRC